MGLGHKQDRPAPLRPPRPGQPIRSAYLRQEYRARRRASSPGDMPTVRYFYAPGAGIGAPTISGLEITPAQALCVPARWTGEKWVPDLEAPEEPVFNSWPGETVPGDARVEARWAADSHWEVGPFSCAGVGA